jgi:Phage integrase family
VAPDRAVRPPACTGGPAAGATRRLLRAQQCGSSRPEARVSHENLATCANGVLARSWVAGWPNSSQHSACSTLTLRGKPETREDRTGPRNARPDHPHRDGVKRRDPFAIPMGAAVVQLWWAWLEERAAIRGAADQPWLLLALASPMGREGQALGSSAVREMVKVVAKRAGLRHVTPHQLRHGFGQEAADADVPPDLLQRLLGHARIESQGVYRKTSNEAVAATVLPLDDARKERIGNRWDGDRESRIGVRRATRRQVRAQGRRPAARLGVVPRGATCVRMPFRSGGVQRRERARCSRSWSVSRSCWVRPVRRSSSPFRDSSSCSRRLAPSGVSISCLARRSVGWGRRSSRC